MINIYAKCSRCGEMFESDYGYGGPHFESVRFIRVSSSNAYSAIERDDNEERRAFRREYPLCPDCIADTLDFVQGEYQPPKQESESPLCPVCHEPLVAAGTISMEGENIPCNCVYVCLKCGRDRVEGKS